MRLWRKLAAALLAALLCLGCAGCDILPSEEFNDYDVSTYIQALLDSSYHNDHKKFMAVAQAPEESAQANFNVTVENAAINFCNAYGLNPDEEQLQRLEDIMAQAMLGTRYQVKDEVKTETGYTVEVTVSPVTSFQGLTGQFTALRSQAQEEADRASAVNTEDPDEDEDNGDDWDEWGEEEPEEEPTPTPQPTPQVSAVELYVDRALDLCEAKAATPEFGGSDTVIVLDIRLTQNGELQLDLNQIDEIDQAVLVFRDPTVLG